MDVGSLSCNFNKAIWSLVVPQHTNPSDIVGAFAVRNSRCLSDNAWKNRCLGPPSSRKLRQLPGMLYKDSITPRQTPGVQRPQPWTTEGGLTRQHVSIV